MIDRSYLPFQSAREHQDRGMMKWMGFFLSEHISSLDDEKNRVNLSSELSQVEKLTLLGQLYAGKLRGHFVIKNEKTKASYIGRVSEISKTEVTIKTRDGYLLLKVDDILAISLAEESNDK